MNTKEMIEVMQAYEEGKKIEVKTIFSNPFWEDIEGTPIWDWSTYEYRVKPEKEKSRLMTHRQLAEWLAKGFGQYREGDGFIGYCYFSYGYTTDEEESPVPGFIRIRPWSSKEWVEPTVDIYERDCKEGCNG